MDLEAVIREKFRSLASRFDEHTRRIWAATEARAQGYGGISLVARATDISRRAILVGLREIKSVAGLEGDELVCVLEEVSGFAGKAQPGSAMFRFGEHFGFIKGVVQALEIRLVLVRPQVWQKGFGLGTASACASKAIWKNKLKAEAQRRFPHLTVTLKTADALLILEYALGVGARLAINR